MLKNPSPLNPTLHRHLLLSETTDYTFASGMMFIPIVFKEMADAAREYPLLFHKSIDLPVVLTGIEEGVNAYLDDEGAWRAQYVPSVVQAYPFALAPIPDKPGEFTIALDADASPFAGAGGQPLFDSQDKPMGLLKQKMELLKRMKAAEPATMRMVQALRESDILMDRTVTINRGGNDVTKVTGLQVINETKFNEMQGEDFLALRKKGLLPLIYSHLLSMANLRQGVIAGKYPDLASRPEAQAEVTSQNKSNTSFDLSLFAADDGDFEISH